MLPNSPKIPKYKKTYDVQAADYCVYESITEDTEDYDSSFSLPLEGSAGLARVELANCYNRAFTCYSFRRLTGKTSHAPTRYRYPLGTLKDSGYADRSHPRGFLVSTLSLSDVIYDEIFDGPDRQPPCNGLVVISGATGAAKSKIARWIAHKYLGAIFKPGERKPHLVTIEDPIEVWFARNPKEAAAMGIDYTPREKGKGRDVDSVHIALKQALRQKPALVYVGETREKEDWKELMHFAGTGHLVLTTSHASSVQEALAHILQAVQCRSPAERSAIASRIHAIVHLVGGLKIGDRSATLPSVWKKTGDSLMAFISDGLSSVSPNGTSRSIMSNKILAKLSDAARRKYKDELKRKALELDLLGV